MKRHKNRGDDTMLQKEDVPIVKMDSPVGDETGCTFVGNPPDGYLDWLAWVETVRKGQAMTNVEIKAL